jgi:hypothetical protein
MIYLFDFRLGFFFKIGSGSGAGSGVGSGSGKTADRTTGAIADVASTSDQQLVHRQPRSLWLTGVISAPQDGQFIVLASSISYHQPADEQDEADDGGKHGPAIGCEHVT